MLHDIRVSSIDPLCPVGERLDLFSFETGELRLRDSNPAIDVLSHDDLLLNLHNTRV